MPVRFPIIAVQFADVRTVGDLLCIGLRVVAYLPSGAIIVPYQAGEIEEGILSCVVASEIQWIGGCLYGSFPTMPISVAASIGGQSEIVSALLCQIARSPAAFLPTQLPVGILLRS